MSRRLLVVWLTGLLVLTGCADAGDGGEGDVPPIGGEESEESSEPDTDAGESDDSEDEAAADIDVTVVPDEITEEYVEAVLAELERVRHEALVEYRRNDAEITIEVADRSSSIFTPDGVEFHTTDLQRMADRDFAGQRAIGDLEPVEPRVDDLLSSADGCIFVETTVELDGLQEDPDPPSPRLYHLTLQDRELVEDYNPTPWVIAMIPADLESWREEDVCSG